MSSVLGKAARQAATTPARGALAALSLCALMAALGTSIANVALPTLVEAFGAPFREVQWVVLAYLLAVTTLIVGAGRLGDIVGRRSLLMSGIGLYTVAAILCAAAPGLGLLIAARAAQGLGAAVMMALAMAFVGEVVTKAKSGRAMGLLGTMSAVGTALGPTLGGALISASGWRAIFLINLPLGIAALYLARRHLPARMPATEATRADFDRLGMVLLAATLVAYALGVTIGDHGFASSNGLALAIAACGAALFVVVEARATSPLVGVAAFRDPLLRAGLFANLLVMAVVMATLIVGPFYLAGTLGLDAARVGLVVSIGPLVVALAGVPAGAMADRIGAERVSGFGLVAMTAGALLLFLLPPWSGVPGYAGPLVAITAGYAFFQTGNNTAVMSNVPADQRGVVSALLNLSRNLGLITGASAMGSVFALAGMRITFALGAALVAAALAISLVSRGAAKKGS